MKYSYRPLVAFALVLSSAFGASHLCAQSSSSSSSNPSVSEGESAPHVPTQQEMAKPQKAPAIVDPAGPTVGLVTSEALFEMATALNACGYNDGLAESDPVRTQVRQAVDETMQASAAARDARDGICNYFRLHRMSNGARDLSQYVSLALYLSPPPGLVPNVSLDEMPPDAAPVSEVLPLLRTFAETANLHVIWATHKQAYEEEVAKLHDPLTRMIVDTNVYLKQSASGYSERRFLVVVEPMIAPGQTNARVYGADSIVVVSPSHGTIPLNDVRHVYLHYSLEPLLYARSGAMDRLLPLLKTVRDAPLDVSYRSDIVALVTESLIRAIEARTMATGIAEYKMPANVPHSEMARIDRERSAVNQQIDAVRQKSVEHSMQLGFVLTAYFYDALGTFEHDPTSLKEAIGDMVYGMDVSSQVGRAKKIAFLPEGSTDVVKRAPRQISVLDQAEIKLMKGDRDGATQLAQHALDQRTGDPARANFILARTALMAGDGETAEKDFQQTIAQTSDPRLLAWSHIYLGRLYDLVDQRDQAITEYKAALTVRDSQPDTKQAAERGLKEPYAARKKAASTADTQHPQ
jgi:hypothetical protein